MYYYQHKQFLSFIEIAKVCALETGALPDKEILSELWKSFFRGEFVDEKGKGKVFITYKLRGKTRAVRLQKQFLFEFLVSANALTFNQSRTNQAACNIENIEQIHLELSGEYEFIKNVYIDEARISRNDLKQYCDKYNIALPKYIFPPANNDSDNMACTVISKKCKLKNKRVGKPLDPEFVKSKKFVFDALSNTYGNDPHYIRPFKETERAITSYINKNGIICTLPKTTKLKSWFTEWYDKRNMVKPNKK